MKRFISLLLIVFLVMGMAACGSDSGSGNSGNGGSGGDSTAQGDDGAGADDGKSEDNSGAASDVKVGLVSSSSGFGDGAFSDLTLSGVERAKEELGIEFDKVSIKSVGDIELSLREFAVTEEYDVIICLTFEASEAIKIVSEEFPDQKFVLLDTSVDADNVACYMTKDHEASFLVGAMAALMIEDGMSDSEKIGFIGGTDASNIKIFYDGYAAGAKYVNPNIQVFDDYVGGFADITTAKEIASTMNSQGIEIIFHAAGMSGNGLFQAAKENGTYAFGVNTNQNSVEPDHIAGSMIKKVDNAAYTAIQTVIDGTFEGGTKVLSLAEGGVDMVTEGSNVEISQATIDRVEEIRAMIESGEIVVPSSDAELEEFINNLN